MKALSPHKISLRTHLLMLTLIIFIPALGIILFSGYDQYQNERVRIRKDALQLFNTFANEQIRIVDQTYQFLKILSNIPAIRNNDIDSCNPILQSIHTENPQYSTIVVANAEGIINCCAIPIKEPIDVKDRSWFQRIRESRKFTIDNFLISRSAKKASLPFAYPILDTDGNLLNAVGAAFDLRQYAQIFKGISLPEGSTILITDRDKKLLYHSEIGERCIGKTIEACRGFQLPDSSTGSFSIDDIDGHARLYFFERISIGQPENELYLLVGFLVKEMRKDIANMLLAKIAILGAATLISLALAWGLGERYFIAPIKKLVERTQQIQSGDLREAPAISALPDELRTLFIAFERMVAELSQKEADRDLATAELRASEQKYRTLFDNMAQGVFYQNTDGQLTDWNRKAMDIFGLKENQFAGEAPRDLTWKLVQEDGSDYPEEHHPSKVALRTGKPVRDAVAGVYNRIRKDYVWVSINAIPQFNAGETKPNQVFVTLHDITDLKKTEEVLKKRTEFLDKVIESAALSTWISDEKGTAIRANPACLELFGATEDEVINKYNLFQDEVIAHNGFMPVIREVFDKGKPASIIVDYDFAAVDHVEVKNATHKVINSVFTPITDKNAAVTNVIVQTIDLTDIKRMERELTQALKMESIGNLAGGIAHDFNNILSSIIGFTELALDEAEKNSPIEDSLQEVYKAGKRARDLVKQILAFARQSEEERKPVQPVVIAEEVLKFMRSTIPTNIDIRSVMETASMTMGNPTQLQQVLMNLCTNAAQAMDDSGGILEVSIKDVTAEQMTGIDKAKIRYGDYIQMRVSDTGVGIAPDVIESIFEPYFTTKGPGEGTGMGLAVVHGIVESYRGHVTVESEIGQGTTLTIYLPMTRQRGERRPYDTEPSPTGVERILFVDDEASIAKMGEQILARLGYTVTTRTSSIEAVELFRLRPNDFDLVITDMTMPNMTGDQLAIELMAIRPDIPIILCTGYSSKITDGDAEEIGIKAFVYKPVVKAELAKTVRSILDDTSGKG